MTDSAVFLMPRTPWRAFLAFAAAALFGAAMPLAALAAEAPVDKSFNFEYGRDKRAWYWQRQIDVPVGVPDEVPDIPAPPEPVPPIPEPNQRVRFPTPQNGPDTLSIAVYRGEHERMAAIAFGLFDRGVTAGSTIDHFEFSIVQSDAPRDRPVNADDAKLQACLITESWADADDPQEWRTRPLYSETDCVEGKKNTKKDPPVWTFDVTPIAAGWGEDPFGSNNGVMILGVLPQNPGPSDTWQLNLAVPARDRDPAAIPPNQEDVDEYKQTKNRVVVDLEFIPGEEPTLPPPPPVDTDPIDTGTTTTPFSPSTDFTTTTPTTSPSPLPTEAASPPPAAAPIAQTQPPGMPAYVWALLPAGLLALAAVRSVVLEPIGGTRPDGAIAAIRRRNAERRGGPIREIRDPMVAVWSATSRGARRVVSGIARTVRSVRRR